MGEGGYRQINKTLNACAFDDYLVTQQSRLPKLLDIEQLSPRVLRVLGQNAGKFTLQGTNTYIVGTGQHRLLIDTAQGYREWADLIDVTLSNRSISLSHVFLTHWHGDHTGGVPDLIRMYPHLVDGIYKNSPEQGQHPIEEGQIFKVEGATLRAVHGPGHSHDHMCFVLEEENAMFTGDNVLGHGTSAVEQLGLYMDTLRKLQAQGCRTGYPAHGAVIPDLNLKIATELAQKTRREKQCLAALGRIRKERSTGQLASVTVGELIDVVHGTRVNEEVRKMALEPFMEEVLRKLAEDGKVAFRVRKGVKTWFALT
ncbi:putative metallo-beta-lactamase domain protein [Aspergillus brunneoviolaceus CBS 621.78]|uniref:Metallo-beta-lactamase domain protein n=2 Tax=Aspergillus TaxID=5052 RepID=A0ACD1FW51_9EURO|nr:putative metallo-beta-lactamase domain protein [Aspergillus brunneoviolaceus CBS 621.78]XP_040798433.1 putative metallo-beta-lactamase domain protein [Aspergillus fijiensis CBS 313.89]RAH41248.1 putative metallo-beta-lactamase domain protein [Aspergillus brunneoviolaceus CBS 621.78]RAK74423.1 putative metallo-beta-lactamase domain protein [Aspergillus fijiensis CBS 313.89]